MDFQNFNGFHKSIISGIQSSGPVYMIDQLHFIHFVVCKTLNFRLDSFSDTAFKIDVSGKGFENGL